MGYISHFFSRADAGMYEGQWLRGEEEYVSMELRYLSVLISFSGFGVYTDDQDSCYAGQWKAGVIMPSRTADNYINSLPRRCMALDLSGEESVQEILL